MIGHSFGGMVAAELAANSPRRVSKLVLIAPIGLWRDDVPIPDIAAIPPNELPGLVLADPASPLAALLTPRRRKRPTGAVRGGHADGQHPALHLAHPGQGPAQTACTA